MRMQDFISSEGFKSILTTNGAADNDFVFHINSKCPPTEIMLEDIEHIMSSIYSQYVDHQPQECPQHIWCQ